jgi:hydrogenase nickel incorporation protein HypA/HybF
MHELSLCRSLLKMVEKKMAELGQASKQVTTIWLEKGALCAVDTASLQFYFPFVAKNTVAAGAALHIVIVPAHATCFSCQREVIVESFGPCPYCNNYSLVVHGGTELIIQKMEVR